MHAALPARCRFPRDLTLAVRQLGHRQDLLGARNAEGVSRIAGGLLTYLESVEREAIAAVLTAVHGNRSRAAETLGISRASLYRKLDALGLD